MKRLIFHSIIFIFISIGFAQPIPSSSLINNAKQYDNQIVIYQGEVIGEKMIRGDYAWLNVNDGNIAVGIWVKNNLIRDMRYFGNYATKGDVIMITGVFHRACPEHGGDLDLHAQAIKKIGAGEQRLSPLSTKKLTIAILLSILTGILFLIFKYEKDKDLRMG
jgi:hypothetical protein